MLLLILHPLPLLLCPHRHTLPVAMTGSRRPDAPPAYAARALSRQGDHNGEAALSRNPQATVAAVNSLRDFLANPDIVLHFSKLKSHIDLVNGTIDIEAETNKDRRRCHCCGKYYPATPQLRSHNNTKVSCTSHGKCVGDDDIYKHAQDQKHTRCFVQWCDSEYRKKDGWTNKVIKKHIWEEHVDDGYDSDSSF